MKIPVLILAIATIALSGCKKTPEQECRIFAQWVSDLNFKARLTNDENMVREKVMFYIKENPEDLTIDTHLIKVINRVGKRLENRSYEGMDEAYMDALYNCLDRTDD